MKTSKIGAILVDLSFSEPSSPANCIGTHIDIEVAYPPQHQNLDSKTGCYIAKPSSVGIPNLKRSYYTQPNEVRFTRDSDCDTEFEDDDDDEDDDDGDADSAVCMTLPSTPHPKTPVADDCSQRTTAGFDAALAAYLEASLFLDQIAFVALLMASSQLLPDGEYDAQITLEADIRRVQREMWCLFLERAGARFVTGVAE